MLKRFFRLIFGCTHDWERLETYPTISYVSGVLRLVDINVYRCKKCLEVKKIKGGS